MKQTTLAMLIGVLLIPVIALIISFQGKEKVNNPTASPTPTVGENGEPEDVASAKKVVLKTTKGDIVINLFPEEAPKTVKNFVTLGKRGYYTNTFFHRIIKDFMIQGGDPEGTGRGGESIYGAKFEDEIGSRKIVKGTVAMANSGPNSNGSQFFIVTQADQPNLDGSYTVFGQIDPASQGVVEAIAGVAVDDPASSAPRPVNPSEVTITGFEIIE